MAPRSSPLGGRLELPVRLRRVQQAAGPASTAHGDVARQLRHLTGQALHRHPAVLQKVGGQQLHLAAAVEASAQPRGLQDLLGVPREGGPRVDGDARHGVEVEELLPKLLAQYKAGQCYLYMSSRRHSIFLP